MNSKPYYPSKSTPSDYIINKLYNVSDICEQYGLYGGIVDYNINEQSLGSGYYLIAGTNDSVFHQNPYEMAQNIQRSPSAFYPKYFSVRITNDNCIVIFNQLIEYCKKAEFICKLYKEYNISLSERISNSELVALKNAYNGQYIDSFDAKFRMDSKAELNNFFRHEKQTGFKKNIRDFSRSDLCPDDSVGFRQYINYFKHKSQEVDIKVLLHSSDSVKKLVLEEHVYKKLKNLINDLYPDVIFSIGEKETSDNGLLEIAKHLPKNHPFFENTIPVTSEEYDRIVKEKFDSQGFDAVYKFIPSHFEWREFYYRAIDEPKIVAIFNSILLDYVNCDTLSYIQNKGPISMIDYPINDFMNFYSLAKANDVRFHIDFFGKVSTPELDVVHVIYNNSDQYKIDSIIKRLTDEKIEFSHLLKKSTEQQQLYDSLVQQILTADDKKNGLQNIAIGRTPNAPFR